MPWKHVMPNEQRVRFVLMVQDKIRDFATACRQFEISRKTGYKWWHRFRGEGLEGLEERSSRPLRSPKATSFAWAKRVLLLRKRHTHWGPKKLRARLLVTGREGGVPASSTIGRILAAAGLVRRARKRRRPGPVLRAPFLAAALAANDVWAVDFKGWFRLGNGERCEPLTVSDLYSRYILCCAAGWDVSYDQVRPVFERLFKSKGQPARIRVDNGPPFGSRGAAGLSRLAVWWIRLGIKPEFIKPGHPEQNGSHERMHRTLKAEAIQPVAYHRRTQQKRLDQWRQQFNYQRPHEALGQATPATFYRKSSRAYHGAGAPSYPKGYLIRRVRSNGEIRWHGQKKFIGEAFVGQTVGILETAATLHRVYFYDYLLGEIHETEAGLRPSVFVHPEPKGIGAEQRSRPERGESVTRGDRRSRELRARSSSPPLARSGRPTARGKFQQ
jgi:transposase InsO family protein